MRCYNLIPEPETEKTPESGRPEDENNDEPGEGDIEPIEINTPSREQEEQVTRRDIRGNKYPFTLNCSSNKAC